MKFLLVFVCLPLLLHCQSRDYFFVPTMRAYNRMLCQSGLPGTENPLVCPQNALPLQYAPTLYRSPNQYRQRTISQMISSTPPLPSQYRNAPNQPYLVPLVPLRSQKRESQRPEGAPKKIYLIPWESKEDEEKPLVNFILVPDELLSPNAPLDTLDEVRHFEPKKRRRSHSHREPHREPHREHHHHHEPEPISRPIVYEKKTPRSSKVTHAYEHGVKHYRTVHTGHSEDDGHDYDDSAIE